MIGGWGPFNFIPKLNASEKRGVRRSGDPIFSGWINFGIKLKGRQPPRAWYILKHPEYKQHVCE